MAADETFVQSDLRMDRGLALGNSEDSQQRRALHVKAFSPAFPEPSVQCDTVTCLQVNSTTIAYQYRLGGVSGSIEQTITIVYPTSKTIPFVSAVWS